MSSRYAVTLSPAARQALAETLPEKVAGAAWELISGQLRENPRRVGKPLHSPFDGQHVARRSSYRVFYRIDESRRSVIVLAVKSRADAYRPR